MPNILKYDTDILNMVIERDKGELIGKYDKINTKTIIQFKCNCGIDGFKTLLRIVENGGLFCKDCTKHNKKIRTKLTNLNKYGVEYILQNKEIKEKIIANNMRRYGVENVSQINEIKNKKKELSLSKYGVEYPLQHSDVIKKREETNKIRYGAENQFQLDYIKNKIKNTNIIKYGVEYASQNPDIQEKIKINGKKYKNYMMPSGSIRKVQGYEPFALDILMQEYNEDQVKTDRKDVPRISYQVDNKNKYYFPDIFIPHENRIIEIKSTWTYKCKQDNIQQKKKACIDQGYKYEIWCFNSKGEKVELDR
jgi:hypothetical protein